jgi:hypothetical protein
MPDAVRGSLSEVLTSEVARSSRALCPTVDGSGSKMRGHNVQSDDARGLLDAMTAFFRQVKIY